MSIVKKIIFGSLVLFILFLLSFVIAKNFIYDAFAYLSALWLIFFLLIIFHAKSRMRLWAVYGAFIILAFGVVEVYWLGWLSQTSQARLSGGVTERGYYQPDPVLGYGPQKSVTATAKKEIEGQTIYNVKYTIGADGLRVCNNTPGDSAPAVLFFGGSFTFGEGVETHETLPCRFEQKSNGRFKSFNFGFHGYGPHQMLATLEHKVEEEVIGSHEAKYLVYQALPAHVKRCSGRSSWDFAGPRYILDEQGRIKQAGAFNISIKKKVLQLLSRSQVFSRLLAYFQKADPGDMNLFIQIVNRSKKLFAERYGGEFYVILWKFDETPLYGEILSKLRLNKITVIEVGHIIPGFESNIEKYVINVPVDYHPNGVACNLIADYLLQLLPDFS